MTLSSLLLSNLLQLTWTVAGLGLLLGLLHLLERGAGRLIGHRLGWRGVLLTGWVGVPIHELSHLTLAALLGHRIVSWKLFDPDPTTGTLGYVRHAPCRPGSWPSIGNFFIGVAPLLGGGAALTAILCWMLPGLDHGSLLASVLIGGKAAAGSIELLGGAGRRAADLVTAVWTQRTLLLPVQLYLGACIASHLAPSGRDLRGALPGAAVACALAAGATMAAACYGQTLSSLPGLLLAPLLLLGMLATMLQLLYCGVVVLAVPLRAAS